MTVTDGRDIDTGIAILSGEASHQLTKLPEPHMQEISGTWTSLPGASRTDPTYYNRPMLKLPVWKPYIPLYYFLGGAAGASLALAAAAQMDGSHELDGLVRRGHWIGIIGSSIGAVLLIADLGRPSRFLYMMRVFRPSSPMNMGAWVLATVPPAAITAGLFVRRSGGFLRWISETAGYGSGLAGLTLATYTGVLVADSAIPVWQASRRVLPVLFGASAVASAGSIYDLLYQNTRASRITYMFGLGGRVAELASSVAMERAAGRVPAVAKPFKQGASGVLWRTATVLTAASLATMLWRGRARNGRIISGALGLAGSMAMRFAVHQAGKASALDPRASFHQQRAGYGAAETVKQRTSDVAADGGP
jgi:formate-dependent nitrite reductase membrane component NrfD